MNYAATVESAIDQVGEPLVLRKDSGGTFDNDTGEFTASTANADTDFMGRVTKFDARLINGTTVLGGDIEILSVGFGESVPVAGDQVIRDSRVLSVIAVDPEVIGEDVMFYRLHVRGA